MPFTNVAEKCLTLFVKFGWFFCDGKEHDRFPAVLHRPEIYFWSDSA